jgi:predicted DNA-binding protein (MmcQ/YjbR family)
VSIICVHLLIAIAVNELFLFIRQLVYQKYMNLEELREYCLSLKGTTECLPFDDVTLVMKVQGKMFALIPLEGTQTSISLKCDPEKAIELREKFSAVVPAWHFNKKHWNTVIIDSSISKVQLCEWIQHSYQLVVAGLPKKLRDEMS